MHDMNDIQLRRLDTGLLLTFEAVLRERNLARAAMELGLTPSAVSHALARLRDIFERSAVPAPRPGRHADAACAVAAGRGRTSSWRAARGVRADARFSAGEDRPGVPGLRARCDHRHAGARVAGDGWRGRRRRRESPSVRSAARRLARPCGGVRSIWRLAPSRRRRRASGFACYRMSASSWWRGAVIQC